MRRPEISAPLGREAKTGHSRSRHLAGSTAASSTQVDQPGKWAEKQTRNQPTSRRATFGARL